MKKILVTNRVREKREALGLTQQELADRVGISRQSIISIEKGRYVPSVHSSLLLARALGEGVEILFQLADKE